MVTCLHRWVWFFLCLLFTLLWTLLPAAGENYDLAGIEDTLSDPLRSLYDSLPEGLGESLPPALFEEGGLDADALREAGDASAWLSRIREALREFLPSFAGMLGRLCLCLLFCALVSAVCEAFGGGKLSELARLCGMLCMAAILLEAQLSELESVTRCLRQMRTMINAMLPVLGVVFAAGGNTAVASAGCGGLLLFLNLAENLCTTIILPLITASCGLSAVAGLLGGERLRGMLNCIKRVIAFVLGLFGAVFAAVLGFQTTLAAGADSVAARSVKFAVSSAVPVVGGAVGETVRTVSAGLGYLKNTVGLFGILLIVCLVLPPLVRLLCYRVTLFAGSAIAELLGCARESRLMSEFAGVGGSLLALLCVCVSAFLLALILFVRLSLAISA